MTPEPARRRTSPRWLRAVLLVVLALAVLVVLFTVVFPWVERNLSDPTLDASSPRAGATVHV